MADAVFAVAPPNSPGGARVFKTLYGFTGGSDGYNPSGVVIGKNRELIGAAYLGEAFADYGTIFSLTPPKSPDGSWTETTLYSFTGYPNTGNPCAGVVWGRRRSWRYFAAKSTCASLTFVL